MQLVKPQTFCADQQHKLYQLDDYIIIGKLGRGSYGQVYKAKNKENKLLYAIKEFKNNLGISKSTIREVQLMKKLQHPNIISFHQVFVTERKTYAILELMLCSLDYFVANKNYSFKIMKSFMYQLLQGLLYCHNRMVIHRDIKPQNILVHHCGTVLKITDFGLAKRLTDPDIPLITNVVSNGYKSPELITQQSSSYAMPVDVWALGVIFLELGTRIKTPFYGLTVNCMWFNIFVQLGVPHIEDNIKAVELYNRFDFRTEEPLFDHIGLLKQNMDPLAFEVIMKMLVFNDQKRYSARDCLLHPFFKDMDKSACPAINEEHYGQYSLTARPDQKLHVTAEHIRGLCRRK